MNPTSLINSNHVVNADEEFICNDLIYLAGFMDGEGHIALYYSPNDVCLSFDSQLSVSNIHKGIIEWIVRTFGATWRKPKKSNRGRTLFSCHWNRNQAKILLPQLIPYLRMKKRQAELLHEYIDTVYVENGRLMSLTVEQRNKFKLFADECTKLNREEWC